MIIEEGIFGRLSADATLVSLGAGVYPVQAYQDAPLPVVICEEAAQQSLRSLNGVVNLNRYSLHLDCYADTYATAKAVRNAAKASLNGFRGLLGSGAFTVRGVFDEAGDDGAEVPIHADELGVWRAGLDLTIYYGSTT